MIDSNINKLISIAERQSDQRLAQELNPQTQTGLLGPAFISASELSYRKKIRDEAQAQPMRSPSIVQQLAQSAMSPMQPMPTAPMPMQRPMPMPQQPMQRFQTGGPVAGAQPFVIAQTREEARKLLEQGIPVQLDYDVNFYQNDSLLDPVSIPDPLNVPIDDSITDPFTGPVLPSTDTRADELIQEAEIEQQKQPKFIQEQYQKLLDFNERTAKRLEEERKQREERRRKRNIQVDQDKLLSPLRPPQFDPLAGQDLRINPRPVPDVNMPDIGPAGRNPLVIASGPDAGFQNVDPSTIAKSPAAVPPSDDDIDDVIVRTNTDPNAKDKNDPNANKQNPLTDDDKRQLGNINTMVSSGVGSAAQKDIAYAASSDYQDLINKAIAKMTDEKGRMQNKWLRIAAGAFNAAQKGSPTLLGGIADLGAGVTEQLLALDADEQKQAQELFALYSAREKLRLDSYNSKYDLQRNERTDYATNVKSYNADLARLLNTEISDDFEEQDAYAELAIQYADMGIKPAQYRYARFVKEIAAKQNEINNKPDISEVEAREELQSYLEDNKHLKLIYDNYMDRGDVSQEEWIDVPLPGLRERSD
jgi:hypothetical protein